MQDLDLGNNVILTGEDPDFCDKEDEGGFLWFCIFNDVIACSRKEIGIEYAPSGEAYPNCWQGTKDPWQKPRKRGKKACA